MTTIGMYYDVLPGKEEAFAAAFKRVLEALRATQGHSESRLFEDVEQPGSYLIVSQWATKSAFDTFITSDAFKAVTNWGKQEILRGRPKHKVYLNA